MNNDIAIKIDNLTKVYKLYNRPIDRLKESLHPFQKKYHREFYALNDVSFEVKRGEMVGIIGKNGSGKSTLLKIITGVLNPTSGTVQVNGRISALLELGAGFNPEYTGMENIFLQGSIMGYSRQEMEGKVDDIAAFAGIGDFIYQPVKSYSSGMFVRLAFAVATIVEPDILIIDEALAVGDIFFRQKCYDRMEALRRNNTSILLVTHGMNEIRQFCQNALLLNHGQSLFWGNADEGVQRYYFLEQQQDQVKIDNQTSVTQKEKKQPQLQNIESDKIQRLDKKITWPTAKEAFFDLLSSREVTTDGAVCTAVALCNTRGEPCRMFTQGQTGVFFYEFQLLQDIDVPIGGILLFNERNILVHGKNSLQYEPDVSAGLKKGTKVRFRQEVKFSLASGDYTFSLGFASIEEEVFRRRSQLNYGIIDQNRTNLCYLGNVGVFSIAICLGNGVTEIPYHGICDLPGNVDIEMLEE